MTLNNAAVKATGSTAVLKNVSAMVVLMQTLMDRPPSVDLPGFGVMFGYSGLGKSMAAGLCQNTFNCINVQVQDHWTRRIFAEKLLFELGVVKPRGTAGDMWDQVITLVGDYRRPIIIDEADKLVDKGFIELVRSLQDLTDVPVLLVGEELLPQKLERFERVYGRVLGWVAAQPCDLDDVLALARVVIPQIEMADDLTMAVLDQTKGRARNVATTLHGIGVAARNLGTRAMDLAAYQAEGRFSTGVAPRRGAAA